MEVHGTIHAKLSARTTLHSMGSNDALWWYMVLAGAATFGTMRPDYTHDNRTDAINGFPQFRVINDGSGRIALQVASADGMAAIEKGSGVFDIELAAPRSNADTAFTWTLY